MNLLMDRWLPVRRRDSSLAVIAPWELTEGLKDNPVMSLELPRADFQGAAAQLLVGVLQTCLAPSTDEDWEDLMEEPPSPAALRAALEPFAAAFSLCGEGPRFMQDLEPLEVGLAEKDLNLVEQLLIDAPGENTIKKRTDLFVKAAQVEVVGLRGAAMALLTLQINAPAGGQGHRQSPRGGGPITTLAWGGTLWESLWRNVLPLYAVDPEKRAPAQHMSQIFPWMAPTRTSKGGTPTTAADVHPLQIFWPMPRRIRLVFAPNTARRGCDLFAGDQGELVVSHYATLNNGVNYSGVWRHPLSPFSDKLNSQGEPASVTTKTFGDIGYQHWLGLLQSNLDRQIHPAPVVVRASSDVARKNQSGLQLWSFGYEMDNMKALAWRDARMPLLLLDKHSREVVEALLLRMIKGAELAGFYAVQALREAWSNRPNDLNKDSSSLQSARSRLMEQTQTPFFAEVDALQRAVPADLDAATPGLERWAALLEREAVAIWDDLSQAGSFQAADPARVAQAHNKLRGSFRSKKFRETIGLPVKVAKKQKEDAQ